MISYQVRFLDSAGRISHDREIRCSSDEQAMDRAAIIRHGDGVEVWRDGSLVCHFPPPLGGPRRGPSERRARATAA